MREVYSYDIYVLGLTDPSPNGRHRFASTMQRLTGRSSDEFEERFPPPNLPMMQAMDPDAARAAAEILADTGVLIEVRPTDKPPEEHSEEMTATRECPSCQHTQSTANVECERCGVVFSKFEREQLLKMQKDHTLEQAMIKAMQVREEWVERAKAYLEQYKMVQGASAPFEKVLVQDEIPFVRLNSEEGPILLTSRRFLAKVGSHIEAIPYEMIDDVDYGGGKIQTKKSKFRLQLVFHSSMPLKSGEVANSIAFHLDKDSSFKKEVVMEWGYARNFICGACGERELEYRTDRNKVHFRCMHCAVDHEVDLAECVAVPLISDL
jgi:hypothetical protein